MQPVFALNALCRSPRALGSFSSAMMKDSYFCVVLARLSTRFLQWSIRAGLSESSTKGLSIRRKTVEVKLPGLSGASSCAQAYIAPVDHLAFAHRAQWLFHSTYADWRHQMQPVFA